MRGSCIAALAALLAGACGRTSDAGSTSSVDCSLMLVTISPPSATLHSGDTLRPAAAFPTCPVGGPSGTARWRSSDTSVAIVDSVSGLVRAEHTGQASVIATETIDSLVKGAMALTVVP